jgi:hypothetical protein
MSKKMTVVFHNEYLYTYLKVEAARRHKPASDIVSEAVRQWLESHEDAELLPEIEAARSEWKQKGSRPWTEVEKAMEQSLAEKEISAGGKGVQN